MDFYDVLDKVQELLTQRGRVSYRALKIQFHLDDETLEALKEELIEVHHRAVDQDGRMLVWTGEARPTPVASSPPSPQQAARHEDSPTPLASPAAVPPPEAERRQLTVLFCDLVDSTVLASQLDPEDLRAVVRAYQEVCAKVVARFEGHIAQYLGDGLLVYFGYPLAHEDDAQRAVRAGLGMVEALGQLNIRLTQEWGVHLAVRLGIHTGLVVVGEVGGGTRQEQLALGETPNLAARLQGIAVPNTLVISATTFQLLGGFFACQALGTPPLKGLAQPLAVYRVLYESMARSRLEAAGSTGWTPLVGREQEIGLLVERWAQVKEGVGQVVLLSGEAGIGKSRLVQVLQEHVAAEPQAWLTPCQCSPYYRNTALYPIIDLLERVALRFEQEESPPHKLRKLEGFLVQYGLPLAQVVPLFATLLSLPLTADYAPLPLAPEQQKQQTLQALLTILLRLAAQQPVLFVMEDLHWVDPTTLEFLSLLVDQGPTARILALLTCRPDFPPPWTGRSHLTQVTLPRLPRQQATEMTNRVAHGKALPAEVVEQVVAKTDGVPLFVEELTKMVLESGLLQEREDRYALTGPLPPLAIPTTLHDSLMARLDRLATVKSLAQLGATLGREFSYALLHAVSPWDEETLQRGLHQLVEAEFLYQRGLPPQATYRFKHALIQDAAYQSLLRSTRQQYHQHIAQVVEARFPEVCTTQPELLAYHYTEAALGGQALPYWQRAGERASQRSAHLEAINHLTRGLEVLTALPATPERTRQELDLQTTLGPALMAAKGYAAPEVEQAYARARALAAQVEETPRLFPILWGLQRFYLVRGEFSTAGELAQQLLTLGQDAHERTLVLEAHRALGQTCLWRAELARARAHLEDGLALYDPQRHRAQAVLYGRDPAVDCGSYLAWTLWLLGYPDQALHRSHEALGLAQELAHPHSVAFAFSLAAWLHRLRREMPLTQERAEATISASAAHGFPLWLAQGTVLRGSALVARGLGAEGMESIQQGMAAWDATGAGVAHPYHLALLAEAYGQAGQAEEGLALLTRALATVHKTGERWWEAELYRLEGELLLRMSAREQEGKRAGETIAPALDRSLPPSAAEECFRQALDVARRQQAKSLELRAAMSLARLWQQQDKRDAARELLAPVYDWFTEGFDTIDLCEARGLLDALS